MLRPLLALERAISRCRTAPQVGTPPPAIRREEGHHRQAEIIGCFYFFDDVLHIRRQSARAVACRRRDSIRGCVKASRARSDRRGAYCRSSGELAAIAAAISRTRSPGGDLLLDKRQVRSRIGFLARVLVRQRRSAPGLANCAIRAEGPRSAAASSAAAAYRAAPRSDSCRVASRFHAAAKAHAHAHNRSRFTRRSECELCFYLRMVTRYTR